MDRVSECSTPVSSISGYNNKISQILNRNSDNSSDDNSEIDSPAATLLKSYLRDSQRFNNTFSSSSVSKLNKSLNELQNTEVGNNECVTTPKSVKVLKQKRFDVSSPSAILRERNPFPKEVFDDSWGEEEELPPPLPFNELLKDLHMYADVRDKEDNRSAGIKVLLRSMGAIVHDKFDNEVTHVIFREGQPSIYKKAKKKNCHLLSMLWLHAVRNTGRRVPEQCYPALNLEMYESPLAVKKIRKFKSMQPDYEDVREDYHRKRLQKVYKQRIAALSSNTGSESDERNSTPSFKRTRKSEIFPEKKAETKRRRTTVMSTKTSDTDMSEEVVSRKSMKTIKGRETEIFKPRSSPTLDRKVKSHLTLKDNTVSSNRISSRLENRNVVVNQTLRPSAEFDLVKGSQNPFESPIQLKQKALVSNEKLIDNNEDSQLTTYLPDIDNRNVVVNCTLTPPRIVDVLERSQEIINKKVVDKRNPPQSPSTLSDTASLDNEHVDSPDLKRVLEALENDNNGSLRKKLLKGLGIKCPSEKKKNSTSRVDLTPEKNNENVFSFVTVRKKAKDLINNKSVEENEILENQTTSTIWDDSPLNGKSKKTEEERQISSIKVTRTRNIRTPSRFLDDVENCNPQVNAIKSASKRNTMLDYETPLKKTNIRDENIAEVKPVRRKTKLFYQSNDDTLCPKLNEKGYEKSKIDTIKSRARRKTVCKLDKEISGKLSDEEPPPTKEDIISKKNSATEPRRMNMGRTTIFQKIDTQDSQTESVDDKKIPATNVQTPNTKRLTTFKQIETSPNESTSNSNKKIPATEPPKRSKNVSQLNSRTSKKFKLYDPNLDEIGSDISLPDNCEPVTNPYQLENVTPKRRVINLKDDKSRRSTFWFQTTEERQKAASKKLTQNSKLSQKKTSTIVCTRLHGDQIDVFRQIVNKLGGFEIEDNVSSQTTHLVAGEPFRTLNMLRAIVRGCWIVNYEWLLQSLEAGQWLQEELHEVTEFSLAVKKCRIERQTFGEPYAMKLFNECGKIYISTQSTPKTSDLEQLVKLAGGSVVTSPRLARIIVGQKYFNGNDDIICVSEKWVLESISHKCVKSFKKFLLPTNTNSKC